MARSESGVSGRGGEDFHQMSHRQQKTFEREVRQEVTRKVAKVCAEQRRLLTRITWHPLIASRQALIATMAPLKHVLKEQQRKIAQLEKRHVKVPCSRAVTLLRAAVESALNDATPLCSHLAVTPSLPPSLQKVAAIQGSAVRHALRSKRLPRRQPRRLTCAAPAWQTLRAEKRIAARLARDLKAGACVCAGGWGCGGAGVAAAGSVARKRSAPCADAGLRSWLSRLRTFDCAVAPPPRLSATQRSHDPVVAHTPLVRAANRRTSPYIALGQAVMQYPQSGAAARAARGRRPSRASQRAPAAVAAAMTLAAAMPVAMAAPFGAFPDLFVSAHPVPRPPTQMNARARPRVPDECVSPEPGRPGAPRAPVASVSPSSPMSVRSASRPEGLAPRGAGATP